MVKYEWNILDRKKGINMADKLSILREKYPKFVYEDYKWIIKEKDLIISFSYKIEPDIVFQPEVYIKNIPLGWFNNLDRDIMDNLVFHLGLVEIPSYWKTTCSPEIVVKAGYLNKEQISWWEDLLIFGMGQFYYENNIDYRPKNFLRIASKGTTKIIDKVRVRSKRVLVPIGGGKDSCATAEIVNKNFHSTGAFILYQSPASLKIIKAAGFKHVARVDRSIDPKLLELNSQGFLNGHTPFSAVLAFYSIFCSVLFDYEYVVFSNERSSEEGNASFLDREVNHQYSKTFEFEKKFRNYNFKYLSNVDYFSFLRSLYEIQISKIFSEMEKYFSIFRSCNIGLKTNTWCCRCSKCLSTFILLYPFIRQEEILQIFSENLFDKIELFPILESLMSDKRVKPLECVGTREEIKIGIYLSMKKYNFKNLPPFLYAANDKFISKEKNLEKRTKKILTGWDYNNNLPSNFEKILKSQLK